MIKLFSKLMILSVVLAMAGPFFINGPNGKPLMTMNDIALPSVGGIFSTSDGEQVTSPINNIQNAFGEQTFYKWKDQNGIWQFTNEAPPEGTAFEPVNVNPNANVINSLSQNTINKALGRPIEEDGIAIKKPEEITPEKPALPFPSTVPLEQIPKLIDQAKQINELAEQRQKALDSL